MVQLAPAAGGLYASTHRAEAGNNFASVGTNLVCAVGEIVPGENVPLGIVPAAFANGSHLRCTAPPLPASEVVPRTGDLAGSNNSGTTRGAPRPFTCYDAASSPRLDSASPRLMPLATVANLTVRGGNMAPTAPLSCVFTPPAELTQSHAQIVVGARFVSGNGASCAAPRSAVPMTWSLTPDPNPTLTPTLNPNPNPNPNQVPMTWSLALMTDGAAFLSPPLLFTWYDPAKPAGLSAVSPLTACRLEQAVLTLRGTNLGPTPRLATSFEDHAGFSKVSPLDSRYITVTLPLHHASPR